MPSLVYNPFTDNLDYVGTGGGGGGVNSVSGTANRITSTGGTDPIIDIAATYVGQTSITTLGTVATGVWNGTAIGPTFGGTGLTTYTAGDTLYASASNTLAKLAKGTDGQVLTLASGIPSWATPTTGTVTSVSGTANRITSTGGATPVIDISAAYVGQSSITTLGTITTGVWHGTAIGPTFGGTGQTTYTTGDTLYASASNTLSKLAIGTTSQSLIVTGGVPTWGTPSGGLVLLSNQSASASTTIDFTSVISASFTTYMLKIRNPVVSVNNVKLQLLFSTNNGSTYLASAYRWSQGFSTSTTAPGNLRSNSDTSIQLNDTQSTSTSTNFNCDLYLFGLDTAIPVTIYGNSCINDTINSDASYGFIGGSNTGTTAVNALRLQLSSGNFASGKFYLYGVVEP